MRPASDAYKMRRTIDIIHLKYIQCCAAGLTGLGAHACTHQHVLRDHFEWRCCAWCSRTVKLVNKVPGYCSNFTKLICWSHICLRSIIIEFFNRQSQYCFHRFSFIYSVIIIIIRMKPCSKYICRFQLVSVGANWFRFRMFQLHYYCSKCATVCYTRYDECVSVNVTVCDVFSYTQACIYM